MSDKFDLAARLTVQFVADVLSERHSWSLNDTLSKMAKTELYERLMDSSTKLWMDNPHDLADLFDKLFRGESLSLKDFF
jgi:hypothetical protein